MSGVTFWKDDNGQSARLELLAETQTGRRVRVAVRRNAYDFQSSAEATVWTGNAWQFVASIPYTEMAAVKYNKYWVRCIATDLQPDASRVLAKALWVLGEELK